MMLLSYALLIESWRRVVLGTGTALGFRDASRIWLVSSLSRYLPLVGWQLIAVGVLAKRRGISSTAAGGAALVMTVVSVATGLLIALGTGMTAALPVTGRLLLLLSCLIGLALTPPLVPLLARIAGRILGREVRLPLLTYRALAIAAIGSAGAWLLYGIAFMLLRIGMFGASTGTTTSYIAVYTGSYLAGYLALGPPAGLGVQEWVLTEFLPRMNLTTAAQAGVLAVASRLWRTVLEVAPAALLLAFDRTVRRSPNSPEDVS
jgi:hypothetical protein